MTQAVRVIVHGRVQGVFFRDYTRRKADELGLSGWVRKRADGTVEGFIQGDSQAIEAMVAWLHQGSPMARVDRVEVQPQEELETGEGFVIRY